MVQVFSRIPEADGRMEMQMYPEPDGKYIHMYDLRCYIIPDSRERELTGHPNNDLLGVYIHRTSVWVLPTL